MRCSLSLNTPIDYAHSSRHYLVWVLIFFFFFQAEDGIRDFHVTGVQTCALPISSSRWLPENARLAISSDTVKPMPAVARRRSEERRVGKECRSRGSPYD